ncbi:putative protein N(5)-glutamine methyltransferase [Streptodolium elevatio]|uniref:peptide chain release factor N(5)-glutamine methyltransferase n=1 Tax=Streptodolium elevatio TaxID=3157996 RepID=A0ABV3DFB8_9ACTN
MPVPPHVRPVPAPPLPAPPATPAALSAVVTTLRSAGCVFAEDEAQLLVSASRSADELAALVARRVAGHPLEHVLGWAEFCGLRIAVEPGVFVPRRRTEFLVHIAAALTHESADAAEASGEPTRRTRTGGGGTAVLASPRTVVVDLCCGSGALGAALAALVTGVDLHAADIDPAAVRCARRNLAAAGGQVHEGDLYEALPADLLGRVDILLANAPYVPTHAIELLPPEARDHEPRAALDGGTDGLDIQRRVAEAAPVWLAPGGRLLVETSERQAPYTARAFEANGLNVEVLACEDLDATVVIGTKPSCPQNPA